MKEQMYASHALASSQTLRKHFPIKPKKGPILAALFVLLLLIGSGAALLYQRLSSSEGTTALIYQDGELIQRIDLTAVSSAYTFIINDPDGGSNTVKVEPGKIGIIEANCPDKICVGMGMVSSTAYPISCLPHKLIIRLESKGIAADSLDAVSQ